MKKVTVCLAAFYLLAFSSSSFAGGAISVQWGDDSKQDCDDCGAITRKKEALHHMLQHMVTGQNTNIGTIQNATYITTQAETCIST